MKHEPCRLLRDAQVTVNFVRADSVLAVGYHPRCRKPLVQTERRILKYRSRLGRKLAAGVMTPALPFPLVLEERRIGVSTARTNNSIGPAVSNHVSKAVARFAEIYDGLLECFRFNCVFHQNKVLELSGFVKYINTWARVGKLCRKQ